MSDNGKRDFWDGFWTVAMMTVFFGFFVLLAAIPSGGCRARGQEFGQRRPAPQPNKPAPAWPPQSGSAIGGRELVKCDKYKGLALTCDLPGSQQMQNIDSFVPDPQTHQRYGMCVFTSIEMAARYQGIESFRGFRDWCAHNYPGGGYPEKVAQLIAAYCKAKNIDVPPYLQYQGPAPEQTLDLIDRTRRMACYAYGFSPRYVQPGCGGYINHMVCGPRFAQDLCAVLDNNFTGETKYEWLTRAELLRRLKVGGDDRGRMMSATPWVFVWLAPPPPPIPANA